MDSRILIALIAVAVAAAVLLSFTQRGPEVVEVKKSDSINLPEPKLTGKVSVEKALSQRRSRRAYKDEPLSLEELSQLLWSAQGFTSDWGGRTAPSAGALYPIELYVVIGDVDGIDPGVYHYLPNEHEIVKTVSGDLREELAGASLGQEMMSDAPITIVLSVLYSRTTKKYGDHGVMYVHMEAGHVGQNIYLQAEALGLGTVAVGAFNDKEVRRILQLPEDEPIYLFPVGRV